MKIFVDVNGVRIERELTDTELMEAWVEQQHVFDIDYIEGMFGTDERFDGMSAEEKAVALSDIAWRFDNKMSGLDDPDKFEVASDAVEDFFEERDAQKGTVEFTGGRFVIEVTIDVVEGDGQELCLKMAGNDLEEMKAGILPAVLKACAEKGYLDNQVVVGVLVEENGEWLDSDEETFDLSELNVEICVYVDALGYNIDDSGPKDNLTNIIVPKAWLLEKLKAEGETDFDGWYDEYTADSTDMIARDAVSEGVILSCEDKRISCVLGLGESFLNVNEYGKTLAGKMREVYLEAYKQDDYQHYGTDVCAEFAGSVEEAAGWCLLTYGDRVLSEIQHEWIEGDKATDVCGFDIHEVVAVLENCIVPGKDVSLEARLTEAHEMSETQNAAKEAINLDEYEYISNVDGYSTFRKIVPDGNGGIKGIWAARHQDGGEPFSITYEQARGFEPIDQSPIKKLAHQLGEMLLP